MIAPEPSFQPKTVLRRPGFASAGVNMPEGQRRRFVRADWGPTIMLQRRVWIRLNTPSSLPEVSGIQTMYCCMAQGAIIFPFHLTIMDIWSHLYVIKNTKGTSSIEAQYPKAWSKDCIFICEYLLCVFDLSGGQIYVRAIDWVIST